MTANNPQVFPKFQINGLFEIPAENMNQALEILKNSGLKIISANIYEVEILIEREKSK